MMELKKPVTLVETRTKDSEARGRRTTRLALFARSPNGFRTKFRNQFKCAWYDSKIRCPKNRSMRINDSRKDCWCQCYQALSRSICINMFSESETDPTDKFIQRPWALCVHPINTGFASGLRKNNDTWFRPRSPIQIKWQFGDVMWLC